MLVGDAAIAELVQFTIRRVDNGVRYTQHCGHFGATQIAHFDILPETCGYGALAARAHCLGGAKVALGQRKDFAGHMVDGVDNAVLSELQHFVSLSKAGCLSMN
jgi:hypothetical protein